MQAHSICLTTRIHTNITHEKSFNECDVYADHLTAFHFDNIPSHESAYNCAFESISRRFLPHVALPVNGPVLGCDPMYLLTETGLRVGRKSGSKKGYFQY